MKMPSAMRASVVIPRTRTGGAPSSLGYHKVGLHSMMTTTQSRGVRHRALRCARRAVLCLVGVGLAAIAMSYCAEVGYAISRVHNYTRIVMHNGSIVYVHIASPSQFALLQLPDGGVFNVNSDMNLRTEWLIKRRTHGGVSRVSAPIWVACVLCILAYAACGGLRRQRSMPGACACGYDLRGAPSSRCPECGASTESARRRRQPPR